MPWIRPERRQVPGAARASAPLSTVGDVVAAAGAGITHIKCHRGNAMPRCRSPAADPEQKRSPDSWGAGDLTASSTGARSMDCCAARRRGRRLWRVFSRDVSFEIPCDDLFFFFRANSTQSALASHNLLLPLTASLLGSDPCPAGARQAKLGSARFAVLIDATERASHALLEFGRRNR